MPPAAAGAPQLRRTSRGVEYWRSCVDCKAEGWYPRNAPVLACDPIGVRCLACTEQRKAARELERRLGRVAAALASIPERYRWSTFDAPELPGRVPLPLAVRLARKLAPLTAPRLVLLVGPTGAGKTTLGTAMFRWHLDGATAEGASDQARSWGAGAFWVAARSLAMARRQSPLGTEPGLLVRAREASVLLVDDLGQEAPSDKDDVVALISDRQAEGRPTLVTFGFRLEDLASRYGAHFERRLVEDAGRIDLGGA
jgi:DNA replication protein DnaC